MNKLIIGLVASTLVASTLVVTAQADAQAELDALNKEIHAKLEAAPQGSHGGKMLSPELQELMHRRSGGLVTPKTNGKTVLIADGRGAKDDFATRMTKGLKATFHVPFSVAEKVIAENIDCFAAAKGLKTEMTPAVVLIVDRPKMPTLSIFPEDAIGIVNVAALKSEDTKLSQTRLDKEVWRALGLTLGGYVSSAPNGRIVGGILSPVYSVADLDAIKGAGLSPMHYNGIFGAVKPLGLQAAKPVPYSVAVKQGWAPTPTNDIQKLVWDKAHEIPKKPIKIEFDPKTDKK